MPSADVRRADVLIVDDDADAAEALAEAASMRGYDVRVAYDGAQGVAAVAERLPDLILLDVEMPVLDGPSMSVELLAYDAGRENIPIILVSGRPGLEDVVEQVGTPYYLRKPFRFRELVVVMERALEERIPPRPRELRPGVMAPSARG